MPAKKALPAAKQWAAVVVAARNNPETLIRTARSSHFCFETPVDKGRFPL
jgi:hypothetical protein